MPALSELLEPMPGRLVVQVDTKDEIGEGGLYLPEDIVRSVHDQRPTQGVIVAMSPFDDPEDIEGDDDMVELKVGDRIIFGRYSGTQISYKPTKQTREKVIILTRKDVLCRVKQATESTHIQVKG